jgi:isoleucyl-tRNA synthetase
MAFSEVPTKVDFPEQELQVIKFWKETDAFKKLLEVHQHDPHWSFIDGPITANNPMGVHHGWGRTYKDLFQRFWAMRGRKLRYQNGFDCQGLWVEVEVEKEMGFHSKKDIEDYGLEEFVRKCKARVLRYAAVQTEQSIRLGYWMDWNDGPAEVGNQLEKDLSNDHGARTQGPVTGSGTGCWFLGLMDGAAIHLSTENNYDPTFLKKC